MLLTFAMPRAVAAQQSNDEATSTEEAPSSATPTATSVDVPTNVVSPEPEPSRGSAAGDDGREARYQALARQGLAARERSYFLEALELFREAHAVLPSARSHRLIGITYFDLDDYPPAIVHLESALRDPRRPLDAAMRRDVSELIRRAESHVERITIRGVFQSLTVNDEAPLYDSEGRILVREGAHELVTTDGTSATRRRVLARGGARVTIDVASPMAPTFIDYGGIDLSLGIMTASFAVIGALAGIYTVTRNDALSATYGSGNVAGTRDGEFPMGSDLNATYRCRAPYGTSVMGDCASTEVELGVGTVVTVVAVTGATISGVAWLLSTLTRPQPNQLTSHAERTIDCAVGLGVVCHGTF